MRELSWVGIQKRGEKSGLSINKSVYSADIQIKRSVLRAPVQKEELQKEELQKVELQKVELQKVE